MPSVVEGDESRMGSMDLPDHSLGDEDAEGEEESDEEEEVDADEDVESMLDQE